MLNLHLLECTVKGYDHISDLLLAKYWVTTGCKYQYCISLTSITIPASVKKIGREIFSYCESLTQIIVEEGNEYYDSRENCNAIIGPNDVLIAGCSTTVVPSSVKKIAEGAFEGCRTLTSITIPEGVTKIGNEAFASCN